MAVSKVELGDCMNCKRLQEALNPYVLTKMHQIKHIKVSYNHPFRFLLQHKSEIWEVLAKLQMPINSNIFIDLAMIFSPSLKQKKYLKQ